jgi:hypothetical protein
VLSHYRLLAGVLFLELSFVLALRIVSWPTLRRLMPWLRPAGVLLTGRSPEHRLLWAMDATGRRWPSLRNCLVRALVAELALATSREPVRVTIGVRRIAGELQAHAWVERCGRLIVGDPAAHDAATRAQFAPLVTWQSPRA